MAARTSPRGRRGRRFKQEDQRPAALDQLIKALRTDIEWIREHTRLLEPAAITSACVLPGCGPYPVTCALILIAIAFPHDAERAAEEVLMDNPRALMHLRPSRCAFSVGGDGPSCLYPRSCSGGSYRGEAFIRGGPSIFLLKLLLKGRPHLDQTAPNLLKE
jgi:hypothetical protein